MMKKSKKGVSIAIGKTWPIDACSPAVILDKSPYPVWLADKYGAILYQNVAAGAAFSRLQDLTPILGALKHGQVRKFVRGRMFRFEILKEDTFFIVYAIDTTPAAELQVQKDETTKLQAIINVFADASGELDRDARLVQPSKRLAVLFHRNVMDMQHQKLSTFVTNKKVFLRTWKTVMKKELATCELHIATQQGERILLFQFSPYGVGYASIGFVVRDVTRERMVEAQELLRLQSIEEMERLRELGKSKMQILRIISHELKTPLTPMKMETEMMLEDKKLRVERRVGLQNILHSINNLDNLITNIVELAKMKTDGLIIYPAKLNVKKMLRSVVSVYKGQAAKKNLFLSLRCRAIKPVRWDGHRIERLMGNLLHNAIKFTKSGHIAVRARQEGNFVIISVEDTGIGISATEVTKLFEAFYQVDNSDTREKPGQGLGLSICKGIVQAHGGKIVVSSVLGKGSTFTSMLPITVEQKDLRGRI
jgi:signal transduction histidine kinase